jgi:hypothetical protein
VAHSAPPPVSPMDGVRAGKSKGEQQIIQKVGRIARDGSQRFRRHRVGKSFIRLSGGLTNASGYVVIAYPSQEDCQTRLRKADLSRVDPGIGFGGVVE